MPHPFAGALPESRHVLLRSAAVILSDALTVALPVTPGRLSRSCRAPLACVAQTSRPPAAAPLTRLPRRRPSRSPLLGGGRRGQGAAGAAGPRDARPAGPRDRSAVPRLARASRFAHRENVDRKST